MLFGLFGRACGAVPSSLQRAMSESLCFVVAERWLVFDGTASLASRTFQEGVESMVLARALAVDAGVCRVARDAAGWSLTNYHSAVRQCA
jgi:hypothetical protein